MTALTDSDLIEIGASVVTLAAAMVSMGHDRPSSSTNYCLPGDSEASRFVWSMFRADLSRDSDSSLAGVEAFVESHGLLDFIASKVAA